MHSYHSRGIGYTSVYRLGLKLQFYYVITNKINIHKESQIIDS